MIANIGQLIAALILSLLPLVYEKIERPWPLVIWMVSGIWFIGNLWTIIQSYQKDKRQEAVATDSGRFRPFRRYYNRWLEHVEDGMTIRMGNSETYLKWEGNVTEAVHDFTKPQKVFDMGDSDSSFYIWIEDGQLRIRFKLRNQARQLIANIDGNEWWVNQPLGVQLNFDDEAIEVINEKGKVQLQVIMFANIVQVSFFNYFEHGGTAFLMSKDGRGFNGVFEERIGPPQSIEPIFKYPRRLHPGRRIDNYKVNPPKGQ